MKLFQKKSQPQGLAVQMRHGEKQPFHLMNGYVPLGGGEQRLYRTIREAVPILDAAMLKLIRLCGGAIVTADDPSIQKELDAFLRHVPTGRGQRGLQSFLDCYLDALLTCGRAIGEVVLDKTGKVGAVLCGNPADLEIREGDSPLDFTLCSRDSGGQVKPLPCQELLLFTPFQPETDSPYGVSILRSMPFLTDILLKIYNAVGVNWERMGNVRFAVVYKPDKAEGDSVRAADRCGEIAREWSSAMQATRDGSVRDFVAVGDVDIKVIGADNQVLDSQVPVRQILEQLIARTGIPPFMLGLTWASTERMSTQQADMMTSELTAIRRTLEPTVERICQWWLRGKGYGGGVTVDWEDVNLQDTVEEARAGLYRAQTRSIELQNEKEGAIG
ncbi:MAG: serine/threonine protein phosphatase [Oscillospiraceae bacterium]